MSSGGVERPTASPGGPADAGYGAGVEPTPPPPWPSRRAHRGRHAGRAAAARRTTVGPGATPPPGWGGPPRTTPLAGLAEPEPPERGKPVMLVTGIILLLVAISGVIVGIVLLVNASVRRRRQRARQRHDRRATGGYEQASDGRITVYLRSSSSDTEFVDSEVSATTCLVQHGGGTSPLRGSSQGFSVTLGSTATIGSVDVEAGQVAVQCDGSLSAAPASPCSRRAADVVSGSCSSRWGRAVLRRTRPDDRRRCAAVAPPAATAPQPDASG